MLKGAGGYTILELIIVLAVSMIILVSAVLTVHGSVGRTTFSQSMHDINAKLISWMADVSSGLPSGSNTNYYCSAASGRPQIDTRTAASSANPDCIFVGKVIQFTTTNCPGCVAGQTNKLYAYSLFGLRIDPSTNDLTANLPNAKLTPAVGSANGSASAGPKDLTETYIMPGDTTVKSVNATLVSSSAPYSLAAQTRLLGFAQSFNSNPTGPNRSQNLYIYSSMSTDNPPANINGGSTTSNCIELLSAGCSLPALQDPNSWPPAVITWQACFASAYDKETARITIFGANNVFDNNTSSTASGLSAQTKLEFIAC